MEKYKFYIIFFSFLMLLNSCQTINEGMVGNKRSKTSDEFLVHKKKPLVVPPDFSLMPSPKPIIEEESELTTSTETIEDILNVNKNDDDSIENSSDNSLEQTILKKIKSN
tara:strand:+ start:249 stop:578 length:330 start_codon:yes stop_codon:yes gene_type:complete